MKQFYSVMSANLIMYLTLILGILIYYVEVLSMKDEGIGTS